MEFVFRAPLGRSTFVDPLSAAPKIALRVDSLAPQMEKSSCHSTF
jgi:hypothetical protein